MIVAWNLIGEPLPYEMSSRANQDGEGSYEMCPRDRYGGTGSSNICFSQDILCRPGMTLK